MFNIQYGNEGSETMQVNFGTVTKKQITKNGYTFTLQDATETSATMVVVRDEQVLGGCYIGGCSGQICSAEQDVITTCEFRQEYACYKSATCARQQNGQCGWTQTSALKVCLSG